jgi:hypothetical protein
LLDIRFIRVRSAVRAEELTFIELKKSIYLPSLSADRSSANCLASI